MFILVMTLFFLTATKPTGLPVAPPKTPEGLPSCTQVIKPSQSMPETIGETLRYLIDVDGLSIGTIDFKIDKKGTYKQIPVIDYKSLFRLDPLVAAVIGIEGRAASLVALLDATPQKAMTRYKRSGKDDISEDIEFTNRGAHAQSVRTKNRETKNETRDFPDTAIDSLTAFYRMRVLPKDMKGCALIYIDQKAYTMWVEAKGEEQIQTPVGLRLTDRYYARYSFDQSKIIREAWGWLSQTPERVPYRAKIVGHYTLEARVHLYIPKE